ncbi:MAG: phosphatidylglycerophosphatase A [Bacteroidia bacterium]|nr:phosphatidylglycerophosphatase A [Bacteroidia bacterium]
MLSSKRLALIWLSGLGLGYLPIAPATWGSLLALPIIGAMNSLSLGGRVATWAILIAFSLWCFRKVAPLREKDPRWLVADEIIALCGIGTLGIANPVTNMILSFLFFRFWDIIKLWPADVMEALPEPWGILADDIVAAFYTVLCLLLVGF